jgi:peptide deformylase
MLKLIKEDNPILKTKAEPWVFLTEQDAEDARQLEIDMVQLMVESQGIGLAANQVGLLNRVFAIHLQGQVPFCMFNPEISYLNNEEVAGEEGCLSFPDLWISVKRPKSIGAKYLDRSGKECTIELTGIDARCFLHELDHLDGVCFTDKVSKLKLAMAIKKQRKRNGRAK